MFSGLLRGVVSSTTPGRRVVLPIIQLQQQQQQQRHLLQQQIRCKHSKTQIRRLLKNPKRDRLDKLYGIDRTPTPPPPVEFEPIWEPHVLPNGWSKAPPEDIVRPTYPFSISRTKNKPHDALGFLPIYVKTRNDRSRVLTRIKKIKGDRERFIQELRAVLKIETPKNPKEDTIQVRTGGTVEVVGNHLHQVRHWLAGLGF
mmetsp:Transcript_1574/g.2232  ORF Transcript_1574/g.2232 Transcript_1574/m.2232 type:complete len:200 (-) Transcript_1574:163-762(-)|eukprot:CAMPEP_0198143510 /NCGR_PEP_ID=MMETSP1443-20131203/8148_1 /TAXON_ID=186043 /ORGANISM="Entomoneis sp., Strain CCMP2396" /LENGTH=199 /DNA_ID=CAMNT_0043806761 /DNA_START=118 /DNA_END=717 /DNA_ORIENTATION=-